MSYGPREMESINVYIYIYPSNWVRKLLLTGPDKSEPRYVTDLCQECQRIVQFEDADAEPSEKFKASLDTQETVLASMDVFFRGSPSILTL